MKRVLISSLYVVFVYGIKYNVKPFRFPLPKSKLPHKVLLNYIYKSWIELPEVVVTVVVCVSGEEVGSENVKNHCFVFPLLFGIIV